MPVVGWFGGYYDMKRYRHCDFYIGITKDVMRHILEKSGKPDRAFLVHTFGTLPNETPADRALLRHTSKCTPRITPITHA